MGSTGNWLSSIGGLLKPMNPNGICPETHIFNGFNGYKLMVCNDICDGVIIFCDGPIVFI